MKIRCDVCEAEASVFCCADEAALCDGCDHGVHHANKLARKHLRFSLVHSSSMKDCPVCDICQERKAFLFCQEDRAILCRECDIPIHKANEHTQRHNRFLLTGIKLSSSSFTYPTSSSSNTTNNNELTAMLKKPGSGSSHEIFSHSPSVERASPSTVYNDNHVSDHGSMSTSSISEYLETIPGFQVDDFLDPSNSFSTNYSCWSTRYM